MRRTYRYDAASNQMVEVTRGHSGARGGFVLRDIEPFVTQDGVEITSRSKLRAYENERGVKQVGNDWSGSEKPEGWDSMMARAKR